MDGFIAAIERQGVQRLVDRHGMCWSSTMATNRVSNEEITSLSYVYGCQVGIPLTSDITSVYCTLWLIQKYRNTECLLEGDFFKPTIYGWGKTCQVGVRHLKLQSTP